MAAAKKEVAPTIKIRGRLSFPSLFEPRTGDDGAKRYETVVLLPPDTDLKPIHAALQAVAEEAWGKDESKWPKRVRTPDDVIRDCTEKTYAGYEAGWHFVSAAVPALDRNGKPRARPPVIGPLKEEIKEEAQAYPGRWANVAVRPYHYKNKSEGVTFALVAVQLSRHDQALAGVDARSLFDDEVEEMEDV